MILQIISFEIISFEINKIRKTEWGVQLQNLKKNNQQARILKNNNRKKNTIILNQKYSKTNKTKNININVRIFNRTYQILLERVNFLRKKQHKKESIQLRLSTKAISRLGYPLINHSSLMLQQLNERYLYFFHLKQITILSSIVAYSFDFATKYLIVDHLFRNFKMEMIKKCIQPQFIQINKIYFALQLQFIIKRIFFYMFPNDDICNVKEAKKAARRIFQKYSHPNSNQNNNNGLGSQQVSSLIKNAYGAININYDPSNQDVFSFMSIFGSQQNGKIQLERLEQLAVKYLCGQVTQTNNQNTEIQAKEKQQKQKIQYKDLNKNVFDKQIVNKNKNNEPSLNLKRQNLSSVQQNKHINPQLMPFIGKTPYLRNSQFFLSPKASVSKKFNFNLQNPNECKKNINQKSQNENVKSPRLNNSHYLSQNTKQLSWSQIINQANTIFNQARTKSKQKIGITKNQAKQVLIKSYRLIGKNKFNPTEQDVQIWLKLCDHKKNGIIQWVNYQNFIKRLMERQNICCDQP